MDNKKRNYSPIDENPIKRGYEKRLNPLENQHPSHHSDGYSPSDALREIEEDAAGFTSADEDADIQEKEEQGGNKIVNNFTGEKRKESGAEGFVKRNKRKGPAALIAVVLVSILLGLASITPGFLLVHVAETITEKLNMQYASLDIRTNRVLAKKLSGQATSGRCAGRTSVACKFTSVNDKQLERLRAAGFTVELASDSTVTGRHKPIRISLDGQDIQPENLNNELRRNPIMRSRFRQAYDPLFGGFADKVHQKVAQRMGFSKKPLFGPNFDANMSEADRNQRLRDLSNDGPTSLEDDTFRRVNQPEDSNRPFCNNSGTCVETQAEANERNAASRRNTDTINETSRSTAESGQKKATKLLKDAAESPSRLRASVAALGVAQVPDSVCSLYASYRAISLGAKVIRTAQMARYAHQFLNTASMIKAGDATPEDVAYFSSILTKTVAEEVLDENGNPTTITTKAATDSYGFRYAAYGDTGPLTPSATEFLAGGGVGGGVTGIANYLIGQVGGTRNANTFCAFVKNRFTQGVGMVASLALMIAGPAGWLVKGALLTGNLAFDQGVERARQLAIPILTDMMAGVLVDDNTFGEAAGDALVSGSGAMMSSLAGVGGNAPLKPDQAVAYMNQQNEAIALYAEEERLARSPLDTSSHHTFGGRVMAQLVPYSSQTANTASLVATSLSVTKRSVASIVTPSTFAADNTIDTYSQCDDIDYRDLNLATDPFCNPIRGIPAQYLEADPLDIIDRLVANESIDEESGSPKADTDMGKKYAEFIANCIDRELPLGFAGDDSQDSDGRECFLDNDDFATPDIKADWYVYHIDSRIVDTMENGYIFECGPGVSGSDPGFSSASAEKIDALIDRAGGGTSNPLYGMGHKFVEYGAKYGIDANFVAVKMYEETSMGMAGLAESNNFGSIKAIPDAGIVGTCGPGNQGWREWDGPFKTFCTPEEGIEAAFQLLDDSSYRTHVSDRYPDYEPGTLVNVRDRYCPEGDAGLCNMEKFLETINILGDEILGVTFQKNSPVYVNSGSGTTSSRAGTAAVGSKMSETELRQLITSYGLPDPSTDDTVSPSYTSLLGRLNDSESSRWAAQEMLNGEKLFKSKGGDIKEYLTTAWLWAENGPTGHPDPYLYNCDETIWTVHHFCQVTNFQSSGFQASDRGSHYLEVFNMLYAESDIPSIVQSVVTNSDKALRDEWKYTSEDLDIAKGASINDIAKSSSEILSDSKKQFITLMISTDPAMAAGLNSYAVSDSDLIAAIKAAGASGNMYDSSYYGPAFRQTLSNMIMALYMFDGTSVSGGSLCIDDSPTGGVGGHGGAQPNDSIGLGAIVKGSMVEQLFEFDYNNPHQDCSMYKYAPDYALNGCIHTGTDIIVAPHAPIYTPVSGTVRCSATGVGTATDGSGCTAFNDVYGNGAGRVEIELDNGDVLILGHISTSNVTVGQKVRAGDQIGTNGGMNSWHVHVEFRIRDSSTNTGWRIIDPKEALGGSVSVGQVGR